MAAPHYFGRLAADSDDALLQVAIQGGDVPGTCLSGGVRVQVALQSGQDPCGSCDGPRDRCGGRPYQGAKEADLGLRHPEIQATDAPSYRRELRALTIQALNRLLDEAETDAREGT